MMDRFRRKGGAESLSINVRACVCVCVFDAMALNFHMLCRVAIECGLCRCGCGYATAGAVLRVSGTAPARGARILRIGTCVHACTSVDRLLDRRKRAPKDSFQFSTHVY